MHEGHDNVVVNTAQQLRGEDKAFSSSSLLVTLLELLSQIPLVLHP